MPIIVSSVTKPGLEEVGDVRAGPEDLPALRARRRCVGRRLVHRAVDAGYDAFAITVDTAAYSPTRARHRRPLRQAVARGGDRAGYQAAFNWDNVKHFKDTHCIPLILKGIATAEDAALCCEHGVDGVYVSNHGGRQLDHGRGSMDVLPEVMAAVRGRAR